MAYSELVSFIKQQLQQGRDPVTIRSYLIQRNFDQPSIDEAFDEVFGKAQQAHASKSSEKVVIAGFVFLLLVFAGIGLKLYFDMAPENPVVEKPVQLEPEKLNVQPKNTSTIGTVPVDTFQPYKPSEICNFQDPEEKYQCYVAKFEKDEIECYEIADLDEKEFCYTAQDLYVLNY